MKYIFIINPKAGEGGVEEVLREQISFLPEKDNCEVYLTKGVGDATKYVKDQCENRNDESLRFIACGGDGTINEVFSGAMGFENVSVTCYPCGSGNDFVKTFGGADNFLNIQKLISAPTKQMDVLKVGDRYSFNVTNFGFDTTVAITVNTDRAKTGHGSKSSYTKGIIKAIFTSMKNKFKVTADGEVLNPSGVALLCTLGNCKYVGGSFCCAPKAKTDDGLIEVCLAKTISLFKFIKLLPVYTAGEHLDNENFKDVFTYRRAKKVKVDAPIGFAYSLDGEIIYESHFTVEVLSKALSVAIPE